jgi:response regulator RpfG family c-di-GMP phosphodiesterase
MHSATATLFDYNMPNGLGNYILDRLKSSPVTKDTPVVIITKVEDKVLERRLLAMGAAAFLNKPVAFELMRPHPAGHIGIIAGEVA